MKIIWDSEESTVTKVLNKYNDESVKPVTRSTIQAQIGRLTDKGWLKYSHAKNTFFYSSTRKPDHVKGEIVKDINKRIFGGSCTELVSALFEHEEISKVEIAKLRDLLNQQEEKK